MEHSETASCRATPQLVEHDGELTGLRPGRGDRAVLTVYMLAALKQKER